MTVQAEEIHISEHTYIHSLLFLNGSASFFQIFMESFMLQVSVFLSKLNTIIPMEKRI